MNWISDQSNIKGMIFWEDDRPLSDECCWTRAGEY